jgi:hypothetical protein
MLKKKAKLRLSYFVIKLKHYLQAATGTKENTENNRTKPCISEGAQSSNHILNRRCPKESQNSAELFCDKVRAATASCGRDKRENLKQQN